MSNILIEIGFLFLFATLAAFIVRIFRQPLLPFFIIAGIVAGPVLHLIEPSPLILSLSEAGIAFLLFIVGIEMNFGRLAKSSKVVHYSIAIAVIQIAVFALLGFVLGKILHLDQIYTFYIALAITFSSTALVVKLLTDKGELLTIHGKSAITILLVQDIFAIIALGFVTSMGDFSISHTALIFAKIILLVVVAFGLRWLVYPRLFRFAAKSQELLFLTTISVVLGFGIMANVLDLSIAIGAFIAGISLTGLDFAYEMSAKIRPLRDFFATLFFITLGLLIVPQELQGSLPLVITIIIVAAVIKPLFIFFSLIIANFRASSSLRTSLSLGQVSEFTLIAATIGLSMGHIDQKLFSILAAALIFTAISSSYLITYMRYLSEKMYQLIQKLERPTAHAFEKLPQELKDHAVVFGYHRTGEKIVDTLKQMGKQVIVVDFNPDIIDELHQKKINHIYGDMGDRAILQKALVNRADIVVSTIPYIQESIAMIKYVESQNPKATIYVTAKEIEDALELYEAGANYVILPHFIGGQHTSLLIERFSGDEKRLIQLKEAHLTELKRDLAKYGK